MISENTKAILLLTAPLLLGKSYSEKFDLLKPKEYHQLALFLRDAHKQPSDLLSNQAEDILINYGKLDKDRVLSLLNRGFLLSQVLDYWESRGIWVISRADNHYPKRFKNRLKEHAPAILYGCGDLNLLNLGGLAIAGSRNTTQDLLDYTAQIGKLSAQSSKMVISGGARGVDSIAMSSAMNSGGAVCGILADSLEKAVLSAENRIAFQEGRLVLISSNDPKAKFNVGNAMQRNKYIYALADAALIIDSDLKKGGTWSGAIEQLEKYQNIPLYVRSIGKDSRALNELKSKGALSFPINYKDEFLNIFDTKNVSSMNACIEKDKPIQISLLEFDLSSEKKLKDIYVSEITDINEENKKDLLFNYIKQLIKELTLVSPKKEKELIDELNVCTSQMRIWLKRLENEGFLIKNKKPVYYYWNNIN
ncbi:DNA-processing protein DprA [Avibacterium endocarditidis]|uniref:DNA-processing protein DprA n=1 Tax=Avibacterium endocarditidis TaxID=380674 RepID=UPI0039FBF36B